MINKKYQDYNGEMFTIYIIHDISNVHDISNNKVLFYFGIIIFLGIHLFPDGIL